MLSCKFVKVIGEFYKIKILCYNKGMKNQQYALPPDTVMDIAFQYNKENLNLHINTINGIIELYKLEEKEKPIFIQLL